MATTSERVTTMHELGMQISVILQQAVDSNQTQLDSLAELGAELRAMDELDENMPSVARLKSIVRRMENERQQYESDVVDGLGAVNLLADTASN